MPRPGDNVHIPLEESEALRLLLKVKPTTDMPRPGKHRSKSIVQEMNEEFGPIKAKVPPLRPLKSIKTGIAPKAGREKPSVTPNTKYNPPKSPRR